MSDFRKQHVCINNLILFNHCWNTSKVEASIGDDAWGQSQMYDWFNHFKDGWTWGDDDPHLRWSSNWHNSENVTVVHIVVMEDGTCHKILSDELKHEMHCSKVHTVHTMTVEWQAETSFGNLKGSTGNASNDSKNSFLGHFLA